jgi:hypothetical protein
MMNLVEVVSVRILESNFIFFISVELKIEFISDNLYLLRKKIIYFHLVRNCLQSQMAIKKSTSSLQSY